MRLSTPGRAHVVVSVWLVVLALVFGMGRSLFAQDAATGAIRGLVEDPTGNPLPGVMVRVTNTATGIQRAVPTGEKGDFAVQLLPPGGYSVTVEGAGLRGQAELQLEVGAVVDFTLRSRAGPSQ